MRLWIRDKSREVPRPGRGERPTGYAERLGEWHAAEAPHDQRKALAQYFTPAPVADFMAGLCRDRTGHVRILDPGAGTGILTCALCERLVSAPARPASVTVEAFEVDPNLSWLLGRSLSYLRERLESRGVQVAVRARTADFMMCCGGAVREGPTLLPEDKAGHDVVISNPPYFKLRKSDPRSVMASAVVHGQPNIYALFMAASAFLLADGGELVFITPRSFASGTYFRRFRDMFLREMRPEAVHVFDSRREAFGRDGVLQENVILKAERSSGWAARPNAHAVMVSSSMGARDIGTATRRRVPIGSLIDMRSPSKILCLPVTDEDEEVRSLVHSWPQTLRGLGLEVSTGPVVAFRALPRLSRAGGTLRARVPMLWMQNVRPMEVRWPAHKTKKPQYLSTIAGSDSLVIPDGNYVVLRRFSAKEEKRRLTAAPLSRGSLGSSSVALENHLNYIHRPGGTLGCDEAWGLAALLNSSILDAYFRTLNGSTQVNADELREMPLPSRDAIEVIGRRARMEKPDGDALNALVTSLVGGRKQKRKAAVHA
jgi:adenine-specific DNA-methyltransferase